MGLSFEHGLKVCFCQACSLSWDEVGPIIALGAYHPLLLICNQHDMWQDGNEGMRQAATSEDMAADGMLRLAASPTFCHLLHVQDGLGDAILLQNSICTAQQGVVHT